MTWEQIKEIKSSGLATIGNHSHSHEYLIDWKEKEIKWKERNRNHHQTTVTSRNLQMAWLTTSRGI